MREGLIDFMSEYIITDLWIFDNNKISIIKCIINHTPSRITHIQDGLCFYAVKVPQEISLNTVRTIFYEY